MTDTPHVSDSQAPGDKGMAQTRHWQTFSVKGQIVNNFSFADHIASVATIPPPVQHESGQKYTNEQV